MTTATTTTTAPATTAQPTARRLTDDEVKAIALNLYRDCLYMDYHGSDDSREFTDQEVFFSMDCIALVNGVTRVICEWDGPDELIGRDVEAVSGRLMDATIDEDDYSEKPICAEDIARINKQLDILL